MISTLSSARTFSTRSSNSEAEDDNDGFGGPTDVQLTPPPDLQVTNVNAPGQAFSGQPMTLSWTVSNEGTGGTVQGVWTDRIYMSSDTTLDASDTILASIGHNGALAPSENYTVTTDVSLPIGVSGDFFFIVETDRFNQVFEYVFEDNNLGFDATATTVNLTPPPDLEVELVDAPAMALASRELAVNYRVTNFGATPTPNGSWQDRLYLSTDSFLDTSSDLFLAARNHSGILDIGFSYDATFTTTLPR